MQAKPYRLQSRARMNAEGWAPVAPLTLRFADTEEASVLRDHFARAFPYLDFRIVTVTT